MLILNRFKVLVELDNNLDVETLAKFILHTEANELTNRKSNSASTASYARTVVGGGELRKAMDVLYRVKELSKDMIDNDE